VYRRLIEATRLIVSGKLQFTNLLETHGPAILLLLMVFYIAAVNRVRQ